MLGVRPWDWGPNARVGGGGQPGSRQCFQGKSGQQPQVTLSNGCLTGQRVHRAT
jgi:hypothetical protein